MNQGLIEKQKELTAITNAIMGEIKTVKFGIEVTSTIQYGI